MKVIVAGSRGISGPKAVRAVADAMAKYSRLFGAPTEIVSGGAYGIDAAGERWAASNRIPVRSFPVTPEDWASQGRKAGPLRNTRMAFYADALVAIWDGKSRGTAHMISAAQARKLPMVIHRIDG